jgi:hypothetical protein
MIYLIQTTIALSPIFLILLIIYTESIKNKRIRRANRRNSKSLILLEEYGVTSQNYYSEWDKDPHSKETQRLRVLSKKALSAYIRFPVDHQTA